MAIHSQLDELIHAMLPFVQEFHAKNQLAPHAASIDLAGEIHGSALVAEDGRHMAVEAAIAHFETTYGQAARAGTIVASAIFFHGVGLPEPARPAQTLDEARAIVALLEHRAGDSVFLVIPYRMAADGIHYEMGKLIKKPAVVFTAPSSADAPGPGAAKPWWRFW